MKKSGNNERSRKIASTILQIVANELKAGHLKNPVLEFTTITDVQMSGDLHEANIFWTVLDEENVGLVDLAFSKIKGKLRSIVGKSLGSRLAPELIFHYDKLGEAVSIIDNALAKAQLADTKLRRQKEHAMQKNLFAGDENPYKDKPEPRNFFDE